MNSGVRLVLLMLFALSVQPVTTLTATLAWSSANLLSIFFWVVAYVLLGALSWGGGSRRGLGAFFIVGLAAVLGTGVDVNLNPAFHGHERNLWPLEIVFNAVAIWIPLCVGALLRHALTRRPVIDSGSPSSSSSDRAPRARGST